MTCSFYHVVWLVILISLIRFAGLERKLLIHYRLLVYIIAAVLVGFKI